MTAVYSNPPVICETLILCHRNKSDIWLIVKTSILVHVFQITVVHLIIDSILIIINWFCCRMHQIRMVWMMWSPFLSTQAVKGTTLWPAWTFRVVATSLCGSSVVLLSSWRAHRQTGAISLTFVNVFIYLCLYLLWLKLERLYVVRVTN